MQSVAKPCKKSIHEQKGTKVNFPRATSLLQQPPPRFTRQMSKFENRKSSLKPPRGDSLFQAHLRGAYLRTRIQSAKAQGQADQKNK